MALLEMARARLGAFRKAKAAGRRMDTETKIVFGELLKEYRLAAGLTQGVLAERALLSARNIQALEGGQNRPLRDTAQRLAVALGLGERERALLLATAIPVPRRRSGAPTQVARAATTYAGPPVTNRHNLPIALSSFVGRERERVSTRQLLERARLVTLTGTGGVGKSRLALAVAEDLVDAYRDGVWLVELAALADRSLVPGAVAAILGVKEEPHRPLLETLAGRLRDRQLLLVLDNCEHLLGACTPLAAALLRTCPRLHILATSREPLRVAGEQRYRVPSLSAPDPDRLPAGEQRGSPRPRTSADHASLDHYEAVRLFMRRAQEQQPDFTLSAPSLRVVAEVCARLDGIPLAIELAAARAESMSVEAIAARLDDRFRLLTLGAHDALPRQQTLRATLDWSYDLLREGERTLLCRLSVFVGGWTLGAAESICVDEDSEGSPKVHEVMDLLGGLVGKSLVQAQEVGGEIRYGLLETVRQYGAARLREAGGADLPHARHLSWCLALAERAEPELKGPEQDRWIGLLEAEYDNLRAALGWACERGAAEEGLRLAGALWRFWSVRSYFGEGRGWLERALAAGQSPTAARARALNAAGDLAAEQGDFGREVILQQEALTLWRALGDRRGIAASLNRLAWVASLQGDFGQAVALREQCLALQRELGDGWDIAYSLNHLGWVATQQGDFDRAQALDHEALALWRTLGDRWGVARARSNLGWAAALRGDLDRAAALLEECLALWRALGDRAGITATLNRLGWVVALLGDLDRATVLLEEGLALQRELGDRRGLARSLGTLGWVMGLRSDHAPAQTLLKESLRLSRDLGASDLLAEGLESLARVLVARGQPRRAARLGGAAEALRVALDMPLPPALRASHAQLARALCAALDESAFATAWAGGRALPLEEAVALALVDYAEV